MRICALSILGMLLWPLSATANLIFTEQAIVNEVPDNSGDGAASQGSKSAATPASAGDSITLSYEISEPSANPFGDGDSVVYDNVHVVIRTGGEKLFSADDVELSVFELTGFYGLYIFDRKGLLYDFLASNSPDVLAHGFLASNLPIDHFDSQNNGSIFANGQLIGFQKLSYQLSGDLPTTPVPEPASYGALAGLALIALVSAKQLRRGR